MLTNKVVKNCCIYNGHQSWPTAVRRCSHNGISTVIWINFPSKIIVTFRCINQINTFCTCIHSFLLSPGQTRKHCFLPMFRHVSQSGQTLGNISEKNRPKHQMFLNSLGNIFASREENFVSATMFPRVGKQGNI